MSDSQEFGGPVNRPAHNARQVTPGEAFDHAQPAGGGLDFLGLNEQVQPSVAPPPAAHPGLSGAPAARESWLLEMRDNAPSNLAPPREESSAQSATAASLLNASWREEQTPKRRVRWLAPVAIGAALATVGMIGLPKLRQQPKSDSSLGALPPASESPASVAQGPASPVNDSSLAGEPQSLETQIDPVEPDPTLDLARPERAGRGRRNLTASATASGRNEAPVNAPAPGESFVPPVEVRDPAGVWTVQPAEGAAGAEGDVETAEPIDGSPDGATRAAEVGATGSYQAAVDDECEPGSRRRLKPAEAVEVDWDRLVWIARSTDSGLAVAADAPTDVDAQTDTSAQAESTDDNAGATDDGVARALLAWSGADEPLADSEVLGGAASPSTVDTSVATPTEEVLVAEEPSTERVAVVAEASPIEGTTAPSESESVEAPTAAIADPPADVLRPAEGVVAAAIPVGDGAASIQAAPEGAVSADGLPTSDPVPSMPVALAASEPSVAAEVAPNATPVRVLARGSRRIAAREQAAARRNARRAASEGAQDAGSELSQTEVAKAEVAQPEVAQAQAVQPEAMQPEVAKAEVAQPEVAQAQAVQPEAMQPEVAKAEVAQSEVAQAHAVQPEVAEAEATQSEVAQAPAAQPEVAQPEAAQAKQATLAAPEAPASSLEPIVDAQALPPAKAEAADPALHSQSTGSGASPTAATSSTSVAPVQVESDSESKPAAAASSASAEANTQVAAPFPARSIAPEPEPKRVLRVASPEDMKRVWSGESIPLDAVGSKTQISTPDIGRTRVVFHTGEVFEGDLVAIGEGSLWLRTATGRLALDGARVKSAARIDAQATRSASATASYKLAGLPRGRVQTPGGTLHGLVLERDEQRTTLVTESGARIVVDSRQVELSSDRPMVQIRP